MQNLFTNIYYFFKENRRLLFIVFFVSLTIFTFFATRVKFIEDVYAIIPKDEKTEKLSQVFQNSKFADKLAIMISLKDTTKAEPDSLVAYADVLAERLQRTAPDVIKILRYRVDDDMMLQLFTIVQDHLPVFLNSTDYAAIDSLLQPAKLEQALQNNVKLLSSPAAFAVKDVITKDPTGISFIALKKLQQLQVDDNFELYDSHILTRDGKTLMMFITPVQAAGNNGAVKSLLQKIDASIAAIQKDFPYVDASYFGGAVVSEGNAAQLRKDTLLTQGITVLFIILFIGFYFKKKRAPFLILVPVIYGAVFSLACIYFIKGSISVIALGTGAIVLGIAVNYSLHVFNHYRHTGNVNQVIKDLSFPLTIGSLTTILGFLSLQFAASEMLKDLGLFAGFSLTGASLCSLIFLPHFIKNRNEAQPAHHSFLDKLATVRPETNTWLVLIVFAITIVLYFFSKKVTFEPDMMQLNYMSAKTKAAEEKMNRLSGGILKSVYLVNEGSNLNEALAKSEQAQEKIYALKQQGFVNAAAGVSSLFISDSLQQKRIASWEQYWSPQKKNTAIADVGKAAAAMGFSRLSTDNFEALLTKKYIPVDKTDLDGIRKNYLDDYISEKSGQASVITLLKVPEQHKKEVVAALETQPGATVLDRQYLTGRLTQMVSEDFNRIAWIVSMVVLVILLLTYGRFELMLISFIPMLISWIWILGIMGLFGLKFNIVNIIVSALIFGLGDDYSLFVMDGLLGEYKTGKANLASYKSSILLSAITTIAGLGVMLFAKHPALQSIAFISVTGILCVVIMSQVLIPFFFNLVIKNRAGKGFHPWTIWSWSRSVFSFFYFGFVSLLLTIAGFFVIKLNLFGRKKGKIIYHTLLSKLCMSVLYIMGNFRKRQINDHNERFGKPAVVIANHQSFLDILQMAMLSPRLILLTNKWVWKSPVFGWAIKMADFYPVANGIENSVDLLKQQIDKGYSVVVFPEGTRSSYPPMKRFHKGAFYLAEKLKLDVVPVLLHGLGQTMTKGDFLLKNSPVTAKYLPRIAADDARWGIDYQSRTKAISKYFKQQHEQLREELEQPAYFKEHLLFNYIYKGPVLEWYLKIKIRLENYYQLFHELLSREGKILDIGCGYGFMVYMLYWASQSKRQITGVDYDEEKIATAEHCFSKTDDINFVHADITAFAFEKYNGITIMDVLHYLKPDQQTEVIEKAIGALLPGGILVIRDGDADMRQKHKGTKLTELFSTTIFSFNKMQNELHFLSGAMLGSIAAKHGLALEKIDGARYTSNVVWVMRKG